MNWKDILYSTEKFTPYSKEHFIALLLYLTISIILIWKGKQASDPLKLRMLRALSFTVSFMIIAGAVIEASLGRFRLESNLPIFFCPFFALMLPFFAYNRTQKYFNIVYFIVLGGATQALITPLLKLNFPHYEFVKFWTTHFGLILFVIYQIAVLKMRPTRKGIWQTFLFVQIYMVIVIGINWLLDANYLFLNVKPAPGTVLDLLGGWPWYIVLMDLILIPYFFILYLPFWFKGKSNNPE